MSPSVKLALGLLFAVPISAAGQAIGPGFELERSGRYAEAASTYMTTIRADPVNVPALPKAKKAREYVRTHTGV